MSLIFVDPDGPEPEGLVIIVTCDTISIEPANAVTLERLQEAVDGYIERVPLPEDLPITMWVNEDGVSRNLPKNHISSRFYMSVWRATGIEPSWPHLFGTAVFTLSTGGQHSGEDGPMDEDVAHALAQKLVGPLGEGPPVEQNGA